MHKNQFSESGIFVPRVFLALFLVVSGLSLGVIRMRTPSKIFIALFPLLVWLICAAFFEWSWHGADPMSDTGRGFGSVIIYRFGLT